MKVNHGLGAVVDKGPDNADLVGRTIVIYHGDCFDGFGAAWVCNNFLNGGYKEFWPFSYGDEAPLDKLLPTDYLFILDFSFSREIMEEMHSRVASISVIEHHKTAQEACEGLPFCTFDMDKSGAGMAWDIFRNGSTRPKIIDYIEDRDLWRFKLPHSKKIHAWISSYPKDFEVWDDLDIALSKNFEGCLKEGEVILRFRHQRAEEIAAEACLEPLGDYLVPVANCPHNFGSDVAHLLLSLYPESPFAAYYYRNKNMVIRVGLRGRDSDDFDVSEVARGYGGGGRKKAAGYEVKPPTA